MNNNMKSFFPNPNSAPTFTYGNSNLSQIIKNSSTIPTLTQPTNEITPPSALFSSNNMNNTIAQNSSQQPTQPQSTSVLHSTLSQPNLNHTTTVDFPVTIENSTDESNLKKLLENPLIYSVFSTNFFNIESNSTVDNPQEPPQEENGLNENSTNQENISKKGNDDNDDLSVYDYVVKKKKKKHFSGMKDSDQQSHLLDCFVDHCSMSLTQMRKKMKKSDAPEGHLSNGVDISIKEEKKEEKSSTEESKKENAEEKKEKGSAEESNDEMTEFLAKYAMVNQVQKAELDMMDKMLDVFMKDVRETLKIGNNQEDIAEGKIEQMFKGKKTKSSTRSVKSLASSPTSPNSANIMSAQPSAIEDDDDDDLFDEKSNSKKKKKNFTKHATDLLNMWFFNHLHDPYPTDEEKKQLATQSNLSLSQVNNWFGNKRMRYKRKMLEQTRKTGNNGSSSQFTSFR